MYLMDIIIMAGGKGRRLGGINKPFLDICGRKLINVSLSVSTKLMYKGKIYVCLKNNDLKFVKNMNLTKNVVLVKCPGLGYVKDLNYILKIVNFPVLILPADMPFLSKTVVEKFVKKALNSKKDVVTLMVCKKDSCKEVGISLFKKAKGSWENIYFNEIPELRDIDTFEDVKWARRICASMEERTSH